jgi:hypothetical protein
MRTSGILTIGGGALAGVGALISLLFLKVAIFEKGQGFAFGLGFVLFAGLAALGLSLFGMGRRRSRLENEEAERGFAEMAVALAKKGGGSVKLDAVCTASQLTSDEAQARMRTLTGKGLFELDFDANGQMVYKVSANAGAAELAQLAGR